MLRRSLFLGLTALLAAVLVFLVIRGRNEEKKQPPRVVEIVKDYKQTPTRMISPPDLEIVRRAAPADAVIRNNGAVAYSNPDIEIAEISRDGSVVASETVRIEKVIPPGQEIAIDDPAVAAASRELSRKSGKTRNSNLRIRVRSAEIAPAAEPPDSK